MYTLKIRKAIELSNVRNLPMTADMILSELPRELVHDNNFLHLAMILDIAYKFYRIGVNDGQVMEK